MARTAEGKAATTEIGRVIVGIEMVKRDRDSFDWWWPMHLAEIYELVDALYLRIDPGSRAAVEAIIDKIPDGLKRPTTIDDQFTEHGRFQEDAERQELLRWAFQQRADWAVCFDADEVIEPGGGKAFRSMLTHRDAGTFRVVRLTLSYSSHHRPGYVLPRGLIQPFRAFRLDRHSRRYRYRSDADGLHCGSVPAPGVGAVLLPELRVIHYHATSCAEYMAERAFYDNTVEVDKHGGIDWLYRCDRFGDESQAVTLEQELAGAAERLERVANMEGLIR